MADKYFSMSRSQLDADGSPGARAEIARRTGKKLNTPIPAPAPRTSFRLSEINEIDTGDGENEYVPAPRAARTSTSAPPKKKTGDPIGGGVLLAEKWNKSDPTGWWMSEKLDGVRAYWNGSGLYSRNGNRFEAPAWFTKNFPNDEALDGELYVGPGKFNDTVSIVKSGSSGERWKKVHYRVFDVPEDPGPFEARMKTLQQLARQAGPPMAFVEQTRCTSPAHLQRFQDEVTSRGVEGTMLRQAGSRYERRRSKSLLKVKDFQDAEATIIDHEEGMGRHEGRLGAYVCRLKSGVVFNVGTGLTDEDRDRPLKIGTVITVKFQELTPAGVPRFPSFLRVRGRE